MIYVGADGSRSILVALHWLAGLEKWHNMAHMDLGLHISRVIHRRIE